MKSAVGEIPDAGWQMITVHEKMHRDHQVRIAADPVVELRWSKKLRAA
jgi:hypothetical protein